jgi:hypothetical protein
MIKYMTSKDLSAALVVFTVVVLVVVGAIVWVHYYYLPHMASEVETAQTIATSTASNLQLPATSAASSTTASSTLPPTTVENSAGIVTCANGDLNCFIAAAQRCTQASVEWNNTLNLLGALIQTTTSTLILRGTVAGKCSFSNHIDAVSLAFASATIAQAESKGIMAAQMLEQLQESNVQAQESVGMTTTCAFTSDYLVQMLTNWSEGKESSDDLSSSDCTAVAADGKPIQSYGGSSSAATPVVTIVYFTANQQSGINGINFKVISLTASNLTVTITDSGTGQSQTVSFTVDNPVIVFGHAMTVTNIGAVSNGTLGGQTEYIERATLTYN